MAYKIRYSPETGGRYPQRENRNSIRTGKWVLLLLIIIAAVWLRINGIPDFLIPGDPDVTRAAAASLLSELQNGSSISDAVTVFCKEILHGAGF